MAMGKRDDCLVAMNAELLKINRPTWFVMLCHDVRRVQAYLDEYNGLDISEDDKVSDIFIPSMVIKRRKAGRFASEHADERRNAQRTGDRALASNRIREEMIEFVFLLVRPSALTLVHSQYWNVGRTRLRHYYDRNGQEITVSEKRMQLFVTACLEYSGQFELRADDSSFREGVVMTVSRGPLKNFPATIYNIHYKADGIRFSMSVRFFENGKDIKVHNRTPADVLPPQGSIVFNDHFIDHIENRLLLMLSRRVNRKETDETRQHDRRQLEEMRYFQYVLVDDPALALRLDALMLVRATLTGSQQNKSKYNTIIRQHIKELRLRGDCGTAVGYASLAYQLAALCVSTADPVYRDELKTLVRDHLQDNAPLRRFLSLIRRMQMRKT